MVGSNAGGRHPYVVFIGNADSFVFAGLLMGACLFNPEEAIAQAGAGVSASTGPEQHVLLETLSVSGDASGTSIGVTTFESQKERFLRRPGAEVVVTVKDAEPGRRTNLNDTLIRTPGVFVTERGAGSNGFISIRGSDIAAEGSRNGRGIRGYIDGIPLGRTDAGLTSALIDPLATEYVEVYRGANSLRYGSIATGGALNFVSKTGLTAPWNAVTISGGSFGNLLTQAETGGQDENVDWYLQGNIFNNQGFQDHTRERNFRFSGNVGVQLAPNIESRTFFAAGHLLQDLAEPLPLNTLRTQRRTAPPNSYLFNERLNLDYQRIANRNQPLYEHRLTQRARLPGQHVLVFRAPLPDRIAIEPDARRFMERLGDQHSIRGGGVGPEAIRGQPRSSSFRGPRCRSASVSSERGACCERAIPRRNWNGRWGSCARHIPDACHDRRLSTGCHGAFVPNASYP